MADAMPETQQQMPELHPVFSRMVQCLMADDTDGLMELYHPEVEWTRFQKVVRGRGEVRALLDEYNSLGLTFVKVNEYVHTDDTIMTRSTMAVNGEEVIAFGAYVIRDNMIWRVFDADEGGARDWWAEQA
jgi:SnoaL-like domain